MKKSINDVVIPLIRARKTQNDAVPAYVDSLLELELPEEDERGGTIKRKMKEEEIVASCSEFLNAGTDTTSTALQWILANLVKNEQIQTKLFNDILSVVGPNGGEIEEEDLSRMEYLKAVVMEGLRRHPPGHFVLPHAVTKEVELEGYRIPNDAVLNFMVAEMGWDPEVWEDPTEFKPERFLGADVDITGSREIKMMPFGVGRRICPGLNLAMLHLEYFVANLVWEFEWTETEEYPVDFSEKQEFTIVMKHPLRAKVTPRSRR